MMTWLNFCQAPLPSLAALISLLRIWSEKIRSSIKKVPVIKRREEESFTQQDPNIQQTQNRESVITNSTQRVKDHEKEKGTDNKPESISENPTVDYSTNPPGAAGFSGTETLPQAPTLPSPASQATATTASLATANEVFFDTSTHTHRIITADQQQQLLNGDSVIEIMHRDTEETFIQHNPDMQQTQKN